MADNAFKWGQKTGNVRRNDVHGEEEVALILSETFNTKEVEEEEVTRTGNIIVEAVPRGHVCFAPVRMRLEHSCSQTSPTTPVLRRPWSHRSAGRLRSRVGRDLLLRQPEAALP